MLPVLGGVGTHVVARILHFAAGCSNQQPAAAEFVSQPLLRTHAMHEATSTPQAGTPDQFTLPKLRNRQATGPDFAPPPAGPTRIANLQHKQPPRLVAAHSPLPEARAAVPRPSARDLDPGPVPTPTAGEPWVRRRKPKAYFARPQLGRQSSALGAPDAVPPPLGRRTPPHGGSALGAELRAWDLEGASACCCWRWKTPSQQGYRFDRAGASSCSTGAGSASSALSPEHTVRRRKDGAVFPRDPGLPAGVLGSRVELLLPQRQAGCTREAEDQASPGLVRAAHYDALHRATVLAADIFADVAFGADSLTGGACAGRRHYTSDAKLGEDRGEVCYRGSAAGGL
ncbi:hypothetical protein C2E23DRAFT_895697 [Lenzites betulinus]|nr:hypothetical protein C2E23DRAFT_895697 [Lenzites betulinus]